MTDVRTRIGREKLDMAILETKLLLLAYQLYSSIEGGDRRDIEKHYTLTAKESNGKWTADS